MTSTMTATPIRMPKEAQEAKRWAGEFSSVQAAWRAHTEIRDQSRLKKTKLKNTMFAKSVQNSIKPIL